ncbi:GNAT family N-acetyltransferase [Streptomyces acidiscabies]|uniref:Acetyltransferase n=1 Tax=Streptomyces acidiscabies TaxID=42234 RepID=A0A0L0JV94_9ACTN|nr:GNAT family N-acetyltransferase [Streptomyces acidiscabies]KND29491.1 acetyltransferase [Streptomyces acidiscabies]
MPDEIVIRAAEERELDAVAGLRWRWFEEDGKTAVVEREEFVRGFVGWAKENAGSHWCTVVVRGERVIGMAWVGGRLLGAVVERARELGVERLTVHSSGRAVPAYVRAGFAGSERLLQVRY